MKGPVISIKYMLMHTHSKTMCPFRVLGYIHNWLSKHSGSLLIFSQYSANVRSEFAGPRHLLENEILLSNLHVMFLVPAKQVQVKKMNPEVDCFSAK